MWYRGVAAVFAVTCALSALIDVSPAQEFPTRPITFVVPYAVGGTVDVQLRALAAATEKHLGRSFVIENRPSATGTLGPAQVAASAKPDGYTLTQIHTGVLRFPFMAKAPYDPAVDFTYIIGISGLTSGLVVRSDAPWKTFDEFLADAKANPGKINYGAPAGAATPYIAMQQIARRRGIQWTHVPFKSFAESSNALLGGHIHAVSDAAGWAPLVNSGELRLLVTYGSNRTRNWPTIPTLREVGIDVAANSAYGVAGPKGLSDGVVKILHDAFKKGMEEPTFVALLKKLEQEPIYQSTEDYRAYIERELVVQRQLVEELGLKLE
jgi:tripartite-type tricarboxylate transporter receptor subunit TctC